MNLSCPCRAVSLARQPRWAEHRQQMGTVEPGWDPLPEVSFFGDLGEGVRENGRTWLYILSTALFLVALRQERRKENFGLCFLQMWRVSKTKKLQCLRRFWSTAGRGKCHEPSLPCCVGGNTPGTVCDSRHGAAGQGLEVVSQLAANCSSRAACLVRGHLGTWGCTALKSGSSIRSGDNWPSEATFHHCLISLGG